MANDKSIIRKVKNKENPYVMITKSVFEDERLSWKAKGLMGYLLSRPDDWQIIVGDLINRAKDGRESVLNGLKELIKYGYLRRSQERAERGRFGAVEYEVYEDPIEVMAENEEPTEVPQSENPITVDSPQSGFPYTVKPEAENPQLLINDLTNNDLTKDLSKQQQKEGSLVPSSDPDPNQTVVVVELKQMIESRIQQPIDYEEVNKWYANYGKSYIIEKLEYVRSMRTFKKNILASLRSAIANNWDTTTPKQEHQVQQSQQPTSKYDVFYQYYKSETNDLNQ